MKPNINQVIFAAVRETYRSPKPWTVFTAHRAKAKQRMAGLKAAGTRMAQALVRRLA